jgi:hypothetical protein
MPGQVVGKFRIVAERHGARSALPFDLETIWGFGDQPIGLRGPESMRN